MDWVVLGDLGCGCLLLHFRDGFAVFEGGSGADEGDEVGRVDGAPPLLGGFDELEREPARVL